MLFFSKRHKILIIIIWLVIDLGVRLLNNVLLVLDIVVLDFVVLDAFDALGLGVVEKDVVGALFLVDDEGFHRLGVD